MKFNINEKEFYMIENINQIHSYNYNINEGSIENEIYKTNIEIELNYLNQQLELHKKDIEIPFEINLGDKALVDVEISSINIDVIDNKGVDITYDLFVEISDVEVAYDNEIISSNPTIDTCDIEDVKESVTNSYEELLDNSGVREEIPVNFVGNDELDFKMLLDDYSITKVLFNINLDNIDKVAFQYNLSIEDCYKKTSKDKTRLII